MKEMLDSLVVVKLNGSLATPLGCSGPTSTIPLRDNLTSLDLTVQQLQHLNRKSDYRSYKKPETVFSHSFTFSDTTRMFLSSS